jgi:hypothetical protein
MVIYYQSLRTIIQKKKAYGGALIGDFEVGGLALSPFNSDAATELKMQVSSSVQLKEVLRHLHGCVKDKLSTRL